MLGVLAPLVTAADSTELIARIKSVRERGAGHAAAALAVKELQQSGWDAALETLRSMNGANPLALNWLQVAFESLADRAMSNGTISAEELEAFVLDRSQHSRARKVAFDWLVKADPTAQKRLIPNMLDDPSGPLRRLAVARLIDQAQAENPPDVQAALWKEALRGAVDRDQVDEIAAALKKLGHEIDLVDHFGLLTQWHVIGPFDNRDMQGFDVVYPPEEEVDLQATYEGLLGEVSWIELSSEREDGTFDLAELTAPHKGAIDYAFTEFHSPADQEVEFRLATANAWKLWVNGELVFAREEYHRGMRFDQYIVRGHIQKGTNRFLLKVCQNEQEQDWAQRWAFQFRVVDDSGRAVTQSQR